MTTPCSWHRSRGVDSPRLTALVRGGGQRGALRFDAGEQGFERLDEGVDAFGFELRGDGVDVDAGGFEVENESWRLVEIGVDRALTVP